MLRNYNLHSTLYTYRCLFGPMLIVFLLFRQGVLANGLAVQRTRSDSKNNFFHVGIPYSFVSIAFRPVSVRFGSVNCQTRNEAMKGDNRMLLVVVGVRPCAARFT